MARASPGGDCARVGIRAPVLHHDEQAALTAVELALAEGLPTKTQVVNLLHHLTDGKVAGLHWTDRKHRPCTVNPMPNAMTACAPGS